MRSERSGLLRQHSVSNVLGISPYSIRRLLLVACCILGVVLYGLVAVFGVLSKDVESYYGLTADEASELYSWMNIGSCVFSFLPGLCFDKLGAVVTMVIGTLLGLSPLMMQLLCGRTFPLSTMPTLAFCYFCFGLAVTFYSMVGSFAPLSAFRKRDSGKVSALVQLSMSLGITVQSFAYKELKSLGGDFMHTYFVYAFCATAICGVLLIVILWVCKPLFELKKRQNDLVDQLTQTTVFFLPDGIDESHHTTDPVVTSEISVEAEEETGASRGLAAAPARCAAPPLQEVPSVWEQVKTSDFIFLSFLFLLPIGFSFSYLDVTSELAQQASVSATLLDTQFGIFNSVGRVATSLPLDYTQHHPVGGANTYILASVIVFSMGLMLLVLPVCEVFGDKSTVFVSSAIMAVGYGGMLGIIPPALRIRFGTANLGVLYGILYIFVGIAVVAWGDLAKTAEGCKGVECFRFYTGGGILGCAICIGAGVAKVIQDVRKKRAPS
uniref:Nodulin-like domain-containing protein n=1 Tax=Noctiluca scintillans TaxID=2966 RepID=A0A7S1AE77_NOCSC